jgi:hypothetical protein
MKEILQFLLSDFWIWVGFVIILSGVFNFIINLIKIIMRQSNIRKHGYPPAHCDANGDFHKPTELNND